MKAITDEKIGVGIIKTIVQSCLAVSSTEICWIANAPEQIGQCAIELVTKRLDRIIDADADS